VNRLFSQNPVRIELGRKMGAKLGVNPFSETKSLGTLRRFHRSFIASCSRRRGLGKRTAFESSAPAIGDEGGTSLGRMCERPQNRPSPLCLHVALQPAESPFGYSNTDSFPWHRFMAIMAMRKGSRMRSVNVAELKNRLSKYLTFAKGGEEVVIRDRNLPVAKLVPFLAEGADDQELMLVAAGKLRLPKVRLDIKELSKIPTGRVAGNKAIQTVIADREE